MATIAAPEARANPAATPKEMELMLPYLDMRTEIRRLAISLTGLVPDIYEVLWAYLSRCRKPTDLILVEIQHDGGGRCLNRIYSDEYSAAMSLTCFTSAFARANFWAHGKTQFPYMDLNYDDWLALVEADAKQKLSYGVWIIIRHEQVNRRHLERFLCCPAEEVEVPF
jgi:hypothetical protein